MVWHDLKNFTVGTGDEGYSFIDRLVKENGWSLGYAQQVYLEYLKFTYLAATSNTTVTPSEDVDQVWHLHLCYTRSYWHDLCRDLLGKDVHHGPTKGGSVERLKYRDCYRKTLRLYQDSFGESAPVAIWPAVEERFNTRNEFVRVNRRHALVYSKKKCVMSALGLGAAALLAGCSKTLGQSFQESPIAFVVIAGFGLYVLYRVLRWLSKHGGDGGGGWGGCSSCGGDSGCSSGCGGGCGGD